MLYGVERGVTTYQSVINEPQIPEKSYLTVYINGYNTDGVSYGVTDSAGGLISGLVSPTYLPTKGNRIIATYKVSKDGKLELFYKEDEQSLYCLRKRSAKYVKG